MNYLDKRINADHLNHFINNGWVNIDLGLDPIFIKKILIEIKLLRKRAMDEKYELGRVYYDHLFNTIL